MPVFGRGLGFILEVGSGVNNKDHDCQGPGVACIDDGGLTR